jgi:dethiobiotin synthase
MARGIFITGTDTDVGKTVVAAACLHRYRGQAKLCYWKPIQTGIERDDDTATVRRLGECEEVEVFDRGVRLPRPLSPHLAARLAGEAIELEPIARLFTAQRGAAGWIVEGAGGALVPINDGQLMTDLIASLALPAMVVARSGLGTINHTLLTLEALRRRSLRVAGVVMVGEVNKENRAAIERYGAIPVLGEMPRFAHLTAENLKRWARLELDPSGLLVECLNE